MEKDFAKEGEKTENSSSERIVSLKDRIKKSEEIRESYMRLPAQGFWTWLTGKEIKGRKVRWSLSPIQCTVFSVCIYIGGMVASAQILLNNINSLLLIFSIIATVFSARYIVATIIHHGVHGAIFKSERANMILCEILSTITLVQPYGKYKKFHVHEHHGREFSTLHDQDLAAIYHLGIKPGVPIERMKRILFWQCINPGFHAAYFWGRLRGNIKEVPLYRILMFIFCIVISAYIAHLLGIANFTIAIFLPVVILYQISSLLHLVTEHAWLVRQPGEKVRDSHVKNSHARFCGRALPKEDLKGIQWLKSWTHWWCEHIILHIPSRLLIVQGSLIVHDWHHRAGTNKNWTRAIQLREEDLQREAEQDVYSYRDLWGIHHVLHEVLTRISESELHVETENLSYRLN